MGARDLWQEASFIDEDLVARAHAVNARVIAWTADDPEQWKTLSVIGVDGICTNLIAELATALDLRACRRPATGVVQGPAVARWSDQSRR